MLEERCRQTRETRRKARLGRVPTLGKVTAATALTACSAPAATHAGITTQITKTTAQTTAVTSAGHRGSGHGAEHGGHGAGRVAAVTAVTAGTAPAATRAGVTPLITETLDNGADHGGHLASDIRVAARLIGRCRSPQRRRQGPWSVSVRAGWWCCGGRLSKSRAGGGATGPVEACTCGRAAGRGPVIPELLWSTIGNNELINTYYRPSNNR